MDRRILFGIVFGRNSNPRGCVDYRTTSTNGLLVVARKPPLELLIEERTRWAKKEGRKSAEEERRETVLNWKGLWN